MLVSNDYVCMTAQATRFCQIPAHWAILMIIYSSDVNLVSGHCVHLKYLEFSKLYFFIDCLGNLKIDTGADKERGLGARA